MVLLSLVVKLRGSMHFAPESTEEVARMYAQPFVNYMVFHHGFEHVEEVRPPAMNSGGVAIASNPGSSCQPMKMRRVGETTAVAARSQLAKTEGNKQTADEREDRLAMEEGKKKE